MENQKPNRFENSKIYKIECNVTGLIYVGSTTSELNVRLSKHKASYKGYLAGKYHYVTSFKVLENNDYDIHLIKAYDFEDNIDLLAKEKYWMKKLICVNKNVGQTKEEVKEIQKIYAHNNRAIINTKQNAVCMCACGCSYTKVNKIPHQKSKKHEKLMAVINAIQIA